MKKKLGRLKQPRQDRNLLYTTSPKNRPMKGPLSDVLLEPPFASVATIRRGPPLSSISGNNEKVADFCIGSKIRTS